MNMTMNSTPKMEVNVTMKVFAETYFVVVDNEDGALDVVAVLVIAKFRGDEACVYH